MEENIKYLTKDELLSIDNHHPEKPFNSFVVVPTGKLHDSGWQTMKLVLCDGTYVVGAISGISDAIHLNGIGGYGLNFEETMKTGKIKPIGWTIDCLPESGCARVFIGNATKLKLPDFYGSDLEIFAEERKK